VTAPLVLLLVIDDAFTASGPGILVTPRFTTAAPPKGRFPVVLKRPDGTQHPAAASVDVAHLRGALAPFAMYRLFDCALEDAAPGTELWGPPPSFL